ncbi:MAG: efflux RND transporter permease subunit [Deltaproteobacteria bacterium]|nr:efflux RND transporter permease subunit [Deltaproteobacteria bacterium]
MDVNENDQDPEDIDDPPEVISPAWDKFIGYFVEGKLIVFILVALLIGAGLYVMPFQFDSHGINRDPVPVDAIPDIGENQQIVFTEWMGRSPRDVDDQVTYPLTTALLGIPGVRTVRSYSAFGFSSIYIIFNEDIDFYWSRSRVLEKLYSLPANTLPNEVAPMLGPDATALGQVYWYKLEGHDPDGNVVGGFSLEERRSVQDWIVRYALVGVEGVSEVASVGGYIREYQVDVDPEAMRAQGVTLAQIANAVRGSNLDTGARTIEINAVEYIVRALGFIHHPEELEEAVVSLRPDHTPIRVRDVAHVHMGPGLRRGALDDAGAETVGGVVVARYGENPLATIDRLKERIAQIAPGLPRKTLADGTVTQMTIVPFYDRTGLILDTLKTLKDSLGQEILIVIIVVLFFLGELRTSLLISSMLPLGVLLAFVLMKLTGVDANVMALGGIAIAIGTMVDMGIVFTENIVNHVEAVPPGGDRAAAVRRGAAEVAPAILTSVATTVFSFLPIFALTESEGKLFRPLAFTKSFAMTGALLLSMVVLPALAHVVLRPKAGPAVNDFKGVRRFLSSILRPAHLRHWVLLVLGIWISPDVPILGVFVVLVSCARLASPMLSTRVVRWLTRSEIVVALLSVAYLLSQAWAPLGIDQPSIVNLLFVGAVLLIVLGGFTIFQYTYSPILRWALRNKTMFLTFPVAIVLVGLLAWRGFIGVFGWLPESVIESTPGQKMAELFPGFGREFMPPFDEGSFLFMPTTMPHASFASVMEHLRRMDAAIAAIPEVESAVGKLGRAETALDPAPISMYETIINYKPEFRIDPDGTRVRQWRDEIHNPQDIFDEIARAARMPGVTAAPTLMPIAGRIVMLQSGMRAPMGIKVQGPTLDAINDFGFKLERLLKQVPSVVPEAVIADRVVGKPYLEIEIDRSAIARYGLTIDQVQEVIQVGIGGIILSRTVEGRERYPVRVRFMREDRDSVEALDHLTVSAPAGEQIPLVQLAHISYVRGPQVIKAEDTFLTSYVLFDRDPNVSEVDVVEQAQAFIQSKIDSGELVVPEGVSYFFSGSYENQIRSSKRLMILIPIALAFIFLLLYLQFKKTTTSLICYSGVPIGVGAGFMLLWLYGQPWFLDFSVAGVDMQTLFRVGTVNVSVAVWVGVIALVGVSSDNGVVLATYLQQRFKAKPPKTVQDVRDRAMEAGVRRVRPCLMTTATTVIALLPVIASQGAGADVMVPMALPSIGGMVGTLVTLLVVPVLYSIGEERRVRTGGAGWLTRRIGGFLGWKLDQGENEDEVENNVMPDSAGLADALEPEEAL